MTQHEVCETCRFWKEPNSDDFAPVVPTSYEPHQTYPERKAARNADHGECSRAVFFGEIEYDDSPPPMITVDGSEYKAALFTHRSFGCAEWRAGAAPTAQDGGQADG